MGPPLGIPGVGLAVTTNKRIVKWEDGVPVVQDVPILTNAQINDIGAAAITAPYAEEDDELAIAMGLPPSEFYGRPCIEVMLIKQARHAALTGDRGDIEAILDRRLGKPKQTTESHVIKETYEEALKRIAREEETLRIARARSVEAVPFVEEL